MGYFDALAASSFKHLENGKRAFYPWGRFGKGYELQSDAQYDTLRRFMIYYYITALPAGILTGVFRLWSTFGVLVVIATVVYLLSIRRVTKGLPETGEKLTFKDTSEAQARRQSPILLWSMLVFSLLLLAGGFGILFGAGDVLIGLLGIGLFGTCTAASIWMLVLRRRVLRQPDPEKTRVFD